MNYIIKAIISFLIFLLGWLLVFIGSSIHNTILINVSVGIIMVSTITTIYFAYKARYPNVQ